MASSRQFIAYRFGRFVLDLERGALLAADGKELPLRPKSFALLLLLVENAGRLMSQEAIMESLWPNVFVTENSVCQCVRDIRDALGSEACQTLRTVTRRGYLFTSEVIALPRPSELSPSVPGGRFMTTNPARGPGARQDTRDGARHDPARPTELA
jgi:DNA-binding winged helix-turn-helix (wHTH) protein